MARQSRLSRYLTIALILLVTPIFVFGAALAVTGFVTVEVYEEDGTNLYIPVPALLFDVAIFVAPMVMPDEALADARREIAPYREALVTLAEELEDCPSGVLVDYRGNDERVQISKGWRSFKVDVDSDDTEVHVKVPARLMSRALDVF
ncbi:MAG TPA: hypothetical protein VGG06_27730 [Thermoanaerobaculia bacterium]|jgi:hypothetical protein